MRHFVRHENIKHFQSLLETESDPAKRAVILRLLAEEEAEDEADMQRPAPSSRVLGQY